MAGTLYVVATPIGNLEDVTFRAIRTLQSVDLIAAEDTRRTAKLLAHYRIQKPVVSLREHNEVRVSGRLLDRLQAGESIALVSDAGTPGIADPGTRLVREARARQLSVLPIPGPNAIAAALSVSGFDADQFVFLGFPPPKGTARAEWLEGLTQETRTCVFFEAPHRIGRTLEDLKRLLVNRPMFVAREISKLNETYVIQPNNSNDDVLNELGEFTVVVSQSHDELKSSHSRVLEAVAMFGYLTKSMPISEIDAEAMAARLMSVPQSTVRNALRKARIASKRLAARLP